jgi:uncharacterized protein YbbK (DUF523 family)
MGGLPTPRASQEIGGGTGYDVLDKKCRVINRNGQDVTREFINGAEETLRIAQYFSIKEFVAKSRSPSCSCGEIYDVTFSRRLIDGDGVTTALLKRNGIKIIPVEDL